MILDEGGGTGNLRNFCLCGGFVRNGGRVKWVLRSIDEEISLLSIKKGGESPLWSELGIWSLVCCVETADAVKARGSGGGGGVVQSCNTGVGGKNC